MQEEEAALLTIGATLEWKPIVSGGIFLSCVPEIALIYSDQGHQEYTIEYTHKDASPVPVRVMYFRRNQKLDGKRTRVDRNGLIPEYWYKTIAEAKAACEVHAATGEFPPSLKLLPSHNS